MAVDTLTGVQARIREIDDRLRELEACELTEAGLTSQTDLDEETRLYREREQLLQQQV